MDTAFATRRSLSQYKINSNGAISNPNPHNTLRFGPDPPDGPDDEPETPLPFEQLALQVPFPVLRLSFEVPEPSRAGEP